MEAEDRRIHVRKTLIAAAQIIAPRSEPVPCKVQNISEGGAMIAVDKGTDLPPQFVMEIPGNIRIVRHCRLAWRDGVYAGMEFLCRVKKRRPMAILPI